LRCTHHDFTTISASGQSTDPFKKVSQRT
jgi:hypothetical protein